MNITRREVIVQGGVLGAAVIANQISAMTALADKPPPRRRSLDGLAWNDPIIETYRDAVGILKQKPSEDLFNWVRLADIHGNVITGFKYCPHGDWYFLPWHRAFTAMYERIVRYVTHNDDFAMPYWDWTANPLMPEVFLDKTTPDGKRNWLCVDEEGVSRTWPRNKPIPDAIVGQKVFDKILKASPYEIFGTSRNSKQTDRNESWVPAGGGIQGTLEYTPHNNVHNMIGGWMPTQASPRDPIFFMHHCNIDRIWALWNLTYANSTDPLWTDMPFTNNYLNPDGSFWSPKVSELFTPEKLGYTYDLPKSTRTSAPVVLSLQSKLSAVVSSRIETGSPSPGVTTSTVQNSATATAGAPIKLPLQLPEEAVNGILRRKPVSSGGGVSFNLVVEAEATGVRALAILRNVMITDPRTTAFRLFLDVDTPTEATPTTDPHYVGTFAVLDHSHTQAGREHALPSFVVDLTESIQGVYGAGIKPPAKLSLSLLPVSNSSSGGKIGSARPSRVEVVVVTA